MGETFYLISNASTQIYKNTLTKFTNHFGDNPLTFNSEETWQVGLESFFLHPRFPNIPVLDADVPHLRIYHRDDLDITGIIDEQTRHVPICLPYFQYSPTGLILQINRMIKDLELGLENELMFLFPIVGEMTRNNEPVLVDRLKVDIRKEAETHAEAIILLVQVDLAMCLGLVERRDLSPANRITLSSADYFIYSSPATDEANPIDASYEISLSEQVPKLIKVQIDNVENLVENNSRSSIISYHAVDMISSHTHYKQFNAPMYLTLSSNHINEFTVKLLDEGNNQLKLDASLPTILKMKLRRFEESSGEFHIVVDSSRKNPNHPNNTGTDFCSSITPAIQLEDDYVCGVSSITYSTFFKTVPIPSAEAYIKITRKTAEGNVLAEVSIPFNPKQKSLMTIEDIIAVLNDNAYVRRHDHPRSKLFQHQLLDKRCMFFKLASEHNINYVNIAGLPHTTYDFPLELAKILGENVETVNQDEKRWVIFHSTSTSNDLFAKRFSFPPNIIHLIPQTLFLYTNFTQPVVVGDQQVNLLQIVPVRSNAIERHKNKYITETFERPNWVQIGTRQLSELKFKIMRSDGKQIEFEDKNDGVLITLIFKKMYRPSQVRSLFY